MGGCCAKMRIFEKMIIAMFTTGAAWPNIWNTKSWPSYESSNDPVINAAFWPQKCEKHHPEKWPKPRFYFIVFLTTPKTNKTENKKSGFCTPAEKTKPLNLTRKSFPILLPPPPFPKKHNFRQSMLQSNEKYNNAKKTETTQQQTS